MMNLLPKPIRRLIRLVQGVMGMPLCVVLVGVCLVLAYDAAVHNESFVDWPFGWLILLAFAVAGSIASIDAYRLVKVMSWQRNDGDWVSMSSTVLTRIFPYICFGLFALGIWIGWQLVTEHRAEVQRRNRLACQQADRIATFDEKTMQHCLRMVPKCETQIAFGPCSEGRKSDYERNSCRSRQQQRVHNIRQANVSIPEYDDPRYRTALWLCALEAVVTAETSPDDAP